MNDNFEESKERIIEQLKEIGKPISKTQLARKLNLNPSTVSKYVDILSAQGILKIEKYGNIHLVTLGGENGE